MMIQRLLETERKLVTFGSRRLNHTLPPKMKAWQARSFNGIDSVQMEETRVPQLTSSNEVLVKVHAASVNPLDVAMLDGYGRNVIDVLRRLQYFPHNKERFPMILGRDFSGEVVGVGHGVKEFRFGDEVWGATLAGRQGSHAEYITVPACIENVCTLPTLQIAKKPKTKSHLESAALPYAALTAWAGIRSVGNLSRYTTQNKRCLVLGASGGVGSFAVQLLRAWNGSVTATCSAGAVEMVSKLGADTVVDYTAPDFEAQLLHGPRFDFILDCVGTHQGLSPTKLLHKGRLSTYVTVVSPVLKNTDNMGIFSGMAVSAYQALQVTVQELADGRSARWAFFCPNGCALKEITELVDLGKVTPYVSSTFPFLEVPAAYHKMKEGHARGKIVISVIEQEPPVQKH
uniref:Putative reticulon-4-interacting protein 1 salivary gland overexpressed n=1 Tax=Rhipicephalus microplus TaxID=6941 RepID=A0A6M2CXJ2_RHIMP